MVVTARRDLAATMRHERDTTFYFVEDSTRGRFFRLGTAEYQFFCALDGKNTIADAVAVTAGRLGPQALTTDQALGLVKWLVDAGLAVTEAGLSPERLGRAEGRREQASFGKWNPWFMQVRLGNPTRFLESLAPVGRVLFSREALTAWVIAVVAAVLTAAANWSQIAAAKPIDLGRQGMLRMFVAWCVLKLLHETAHGLACRRFGGSVSKFGVALILGLPSPFVETTSAWRMPNKWQRIVVSLAGIYVELFVAALAVLFWAHTTGDVWRQLALSIAAVASISTLMFNLNPLMRFDGYFALSDWLEIPNLAGLAKHKCSRGLRRYLLGRDEPVAETATNTPAWVAWYGAAAGLWRVFMVSGMLLLSLSRFGATITGLLCILPVTFCVAQTRRWWMKRKRTAATTSSTNVPRLLKTYGGLAAAAAVALYFFDPREIHLPAAIEYEPLCIVRAVAPGFVEQIHVVDGTEIAAGQLLVELRNDELETQIRETEAEVAQSAARSWVHREAKEIAKEQAESRRRQALEAKLHELSERRATLTIRSPIAGRIVSHGLAAFAGCWLEEGGELLIVGDESKKKLIVAVPQTDVDLITDGNRAEASAVLTGSWSTVPVEIGAVEPRAVRTLPHAALSVENGGSLPVRRLEDEENAGDDEKRLVVELHEPYFRLHGRLTPDVAADLFAGRTAEVTVRTGWLGLMKRTWTRTDAWLATVIE
jgi:putative peptide zinc metalloprotease protein